MDNLNWIPKTAWFGTERSLQDLISATEMVKDSISVEGLGNTFRLNFENGAKTKLGPYDDEEDEKSYLLEIHGEVAVIQVNGTMTNNDSWMNRYFGIVSYQEIKAAIIDAVNEESVKKILIVFNSGGGPVDGVFELSDFIKEVNTFIKPIHSMASGLMGSAAYLLGSTARKVHSTKMSTVGSIGVITVHKEYSKQLKEAGIKVNIIRTGKYKALVNPFEPLSKEAEKELQDYSDKIYNMFISHVAIQRNASLEEVDNNMAQGREFLGEDAFKIGLVDNITNLDKLVIELDEQNDASHRAANSALGDPTIGDEDMKKRVAKLSAENQAKLAAGVPMTELELTEEELPGKGDGKTELKVEKSKDDKLEIKPGEKASGEEGASGEEESNSESSPDLVSYLKEQNSELGSTNAELTVSNKGLETELSTVKTASGKLESIVRMAMDRLAINLGNTGADYSSLTGLALCEAHARLNSKFEETYPVGGVASLKVEDKQPSASNQHTSAAVDAAKVN